MTQKGYNKKIANEICRILKIGLGFSCEIEQIKRSLFSFRKKKYLIKTDAPEFVIKDIMMTL